jgi:hypothetical protein
MQRIVSRRELGKFGTVIELRNKPHDLSYVTGRSLERRACPRERTAPHFCHREARSDVAISSFGGHCRGIASPSARNDGGSAVQAIALSYVRGRLAARTSTVPREVARTSRAVTVRERRHDPAAWNKSAIDVAV